MSAAQEEYLRAISKLQESGKPVTISELAAAVGVTAPSVSGMVQRLETDGLVNRLPRAGVRLSSRGEALAIGMHRRHRLIETFLVKVLGLDWGEVHEEAGALEHHLSDRVLHAIDRCLGFPRVDPHGHPIPAPDGTMIARDLLPLESLEVGGTAVVRELGSEAPDRLRMWQDLGLVPGARVTVVRTRVLEGLWVLDVAGREVITGQKGVAGLQVERVTNG